MGGAGPPGSSVVDAAHPDALRPLHVGDGIVTDVGRFTRPDAELREGSPEDLGVGLTVADLVGVGDGREMAQEIVPLEDPPQDDARSPAGVGDDAARDTPRRELAHGLRRPRRELWRHVEHRLDVAGERLLEKGGRQDVVVDYEPRSYVLVVPSVT